MHTVAPKSTSAQAPAVNIGEWLSQQGEAWRVYFRQEVLRAGVSLALLYLTFLSFDSYVVYFPYIGKVDMMQR